MDTLMNSIDDIKEKLTDMEYKTLCDQMLVLSKVKKTTERMCELKFARFMPHHYIDDSETEYSYYIKTQILIIQLRCNMEEVESIQSDIEDEGSYELLLSDLKTLTGTDSFACRLWDEYMGGHLFIKVDCIDDELKPSEIRMLKATSVSLISMNML
jgi:hypothetical protein